MSTAIATRQDNAAAIMEQVIVKGDLAKLSPQERNAYYGQVCQSMGLNPLTRPFEYLTLNGKMVLYARRDCADQLRKINGISIEIVSRSIEDGLITVHVRAKDNSGRADEDFGIVALGGLKGEAAANAVLKAVTKAKRRVTLSLSGLGWLDETEVEDIPSSAKTHAVPAPVPVAPAKVEPPVNPETGEVSPHSIYVAVGGAMGWVQAFLSAIDSSADMTDLAEWIDLNKESLDRIKADSTKLYTRIDERIVGVRARLTPAAEMTVAAE